MRVAPLAALVLTVAVLAGCGGGSSSNGVASKSAADIFVAAQAAATGASAVHMSGTIMSGGAPITLDLHIVSAKGGTGHMTEKGAGFDVVRIGNKVYIRGSEAFFRGIAGAAAAQLLKGKWLVGSATTGELSAFTSLTDLRKFFVGALGSHGTLTKGRETTVNGQKVIAVTDTSKGGTIYVATTGKPYPIELDSPGNGKQGKITFDGWNRTVTITAPKGAIDVSKLNG
jgi:hypothetical protein